MCYRLLKRLRAPIGIGALLISCCMLTGCSKDAEFSSKEKQQLKDGPPKEMPEQAKKMFEQAGKAGVGGGPPAGTPGGPPGGSDQPKTGQ